MDASWIACRESLSRGRLTIQGLLQVDDHDDRRLDRCPEEGDIADQTATLMWNSDTNPLLAITGREEEFEGMGRKRRRGGLATITGAESPEQKISAREREGNGEEAIPPTGITPAQYPARIAAAVPTRPGDRTATSSRRIAARSSRSSRA